MTLAPIGIIVGLLQLLVDGIYGRLAPVNAGQKEAGVLVAGTVVGQVAGGETAEETRLFVVRVVFEYAELFTVDTVLFANVLARVDWVTFLGGAGRAEARTTVSASASYHFVVRIVRYHFVRMVLLKVGEPPAVQLLLVARERDIN